MYCPRCAAQTSHDTNFCNKCGLDVRMVHDALEGRRPPEQFDWNKTWLVEMLLSDDERMRRRAAAEVALSDESAVNELRRIKDLKTGIITCFSGIGVAVFLWFLLGSIAGAVATRDPQGAAILSQIWIAGVIPFAVGLGMIFNALVIDGKRLRMGKASMRNLQKPAAITSGSVGSTTSGLPALGPRQEMSSVTEHTTDLLTGPTPVARRDTDSRT